MTRSARWPSRMSKNGWEAYPDARLWSEGPSGYSGVVGRPSRMTGSGRLALPDDQEWSVGTPGCLGVVGRPSRMSGSGREAPRLSGSDRETFPEVREPLPNVR